MLTCVFLCKICHYMQTYIVRLDLIIFSAAIGFTSIEFLLGIITVISFATA